jgi:subtilase family serine protease
LNDYIEDVFHVRDFPFPMRDMIKSSGDTDVDVPLRFSDGGIQSDTHSSTTVEQKKKNSLKSRPPANVQTPLFNYATSKDNYNKGRSSMSLSMSSMSGPVVDGYVTPQRLQTWYNITRSLPAWLSEQGVAATLNITSKSTQNENRKQVTQAIYSTIGQTVSPKDLATFQRLFKLPQPYHNISLFLHGHVDDYACWDSIESCTEANLDFQYLISTTTPIEEVEEAVEDLKGSVQPGEDPAEDHIAAASRKKDVEIVTISYYDDSASWTNWLLDIASMSDSDADSTSDASSMTFPPKVISISYGSIEYYLLPSTKRLFNIEVMKLGLQGVSVIAASGDDGVAGFGLLSQRTICGYYPTFPASSPYVTTVGGTMVS